MDHLAEYRSTMIMSTEGKTQEWLLFIGFMLRFTPSAAPYILPSNIRRCPVPVFWLVLQNHSNTWLKIGSETIIENIRNTEEFALIMSLIFWSQNHLGSTSENFSPDIYYQNQVLKSDLLISEGI